MLQFLQTGKALYVFAVLCGIGIMSKLVTGSLYKRMVKETANMTLTKNRNLKALKQKTENMFLISHGIRNAGAYIEKQMYCFRFMGMALDDWDNISVQAMILCFLTGGAAAFGSYWYRCDSYYIVLYGTLGILSGLFMVLVDNGANTSSKRQQLADCLVDYVENSPHLHKNVDKAPVRSSGISSRVGDATVRKGPAVAVLEKADKPLGQKPGGRLAILPKKKSTDKDPDRINLKESGRGETPAAGGDELVKSIAYLRESLDQIAASREHARGEDDSGDKPSAGGQESKAHRELKPEEVRLLGELLQQYLP